MAADRPSAHTGNFFMDRLQRTASWFHLTVLGVSYVISGDYAGWNPGLLNGFASFLLGFALVAAFYLALGLCMAEMSSALPTAGAGYTFARTAMGQFAGYMTGITVLAEYTLTASAIGAFTVNYFNTLIAKDWPVWPVLLFLYAACITLHVLGVGEALKILLVITGLAIVGLFLFLGGAAASTTFSAANFASHITARGVWQSIPNATWFFLAIEGVPLAAEEAVVPEKDVPRGLLASWAILTLFGVISTVFCTGSIGPLATAESGSPLVDAIENYGLRQTINIVGLSGLLASFFSVIYGYSRLTYAMARAGFLPRALGATNAFHAPWVALIVPSAIGYAISFCTVGDRLLQAAVCAATASYCLILASYLVLKWRRDFASPYRAPAGRVLGVAALLGAVAMLAATVIAHYVIALSVAAFLGLAALYYWTYARKKATGLDDDTAMSSSVKRSMSASTLAASPAISGVSGE